VRSIGKSNESNDGEHLSKKEIEYLLRALRANIKAAKTAIMGQEPKLRDLFETELNTFFPLECDPIWESAFGAVVKEWERQNEVVETRCRERGIPRRFWPSIRHPAWLSGGLNMIKEVRAEMRRAAYVRIKALVTECLEQHERDSANTQLEILAHGCLTPIAKAFFDRLPKIEDLIKPVTASEAFTMLEGGALPLAQRRLYSWEKSKLPEYLPDIDKSGEDDEDT
jgi:hypothetical protein